MLPMRLGRYLHTIARRRGYRRMSVALFIMDGKRIAVDEMLEVPRRCSEGWRIEEFLGELCGLAGLAPSAAKYIGSIFLADSATIQFNFLAFCQSPEGLRFVRVDEARMKMSADEARMLEKAASD